jgi:hypothetical protein
MGWRLPEKSRIRNRLPHGKENRWCGQPPALPIPSLARRHGSWLCGLGGCPVHLICGGVLAGPHPRHSAAWHLVQVYSGLENCNTQSCLQGHKTSSATVQHFADTPWAAKLLWCGVGQRSRREFLQKPCRGLPPPLSVLPLQAPGKNQGRLHVGGGLLENANRLQLAWRGSTIGAA